MILHLKLIRTDYSNFKHRASRLITLSGPLTSHIPMFQELSWPSRQHRHDIHNLNTRYASLIVTKHAKTRTAYYHVSYICETLNKNYLNLLCYISVANIGNMRIPMKLIWAEKCTCQWNIPIYCVTVNIIVLPWLVSTLKFHIENKTFKGQPFIAWKTCISLLQSWYIFKSKCNVTVILTWQFEVIIYLWGELSEAKPITWFILYSSPINKIWNLFI